MSDTKAPNALLELTGITKAFGAVVANQDVAFALRAGEIHALVGENGAGKTTLMRVLYGMYRPEAGLIRLDGHEVRLNSPADAIAHGIGMVHQHFMLVPSFTVAENITLGAEPGPAGLYDRERAVEAVREPMERLGVDLDPDAVTATLSVATQQKLEIIKVLYRGARIMILDEPTAVLTPQETDELFTLLRRLADGGTSIIFISHKLREVFDIADQITVLRRGRTAPSVLTSDTDQQTVVAAMTGRTDVNLGRVEHQRRPGDVVLAADGVCTAGHDHDAALRDVSLAVRGGEIVGIAGVEGNGQTTLAEVLIGTATTTSGLITIANDSIAGLDVAERRSLGLAYVPEDRHREGIPVNGTVLEGLTAGRLRAGQAPRPWANAFSKTLRRWAGEVIARYSITTPDAEARCSTLSGGNQQKVVIARELEDRPMCLLLAQPTRGVDLGAIEFIYERITQAAEHGCAVLLISADLDELLRLTDRVLVMYGGQIVAERETARTTREELGTYMTGSDTATSAA